MSLSPELREIASQANDLLKQIADVHRRKVQQQTRLEARVAAVHERYGSEVEILKLQEEKLIDELVNLVKRPTLLLLADKGTKTIKLRSGTIAERVTGRPALVIEDGFTENNIIKQIARLGGLRKFTRLGKRTLDKEALKRNPEFMSRIRGLSIKQSAQLIINPTKVQGEIIRETDPLSLDLTK